jgi:hypothetical protein
LAKRDVSECAPRLTGGRIGLGMVGRGEGTFIGALHRIAARIDDPSTTRYSVCWTRF